MRILFCGDVVGKAGCDAIANYIPHLRKTLALDCVIVNGENAAGGFGITRKIADEFLSNGVDVITGGDHIWDQKETIHFISGFPKLLRPQNFPKQIPGTGTYMFTTSLGQNILIVHVMGQVFMKYTLDNPFVTVETALSHYRLGENVDAIIVDIHAEATSEKMAMGHFLDGRASLVVGTHTHVPTADTSILSGGTAYQTDAGMCGDYDSVIGFDKAVPLQNFIHKIRTDRMKPASGEATLCGVLLETDEKSGLAKAVYPVRMGGRLAPSVPALE